MSNAAALYAPLSTSPPVCSEHDLEGSDSGSSDPNSCLLSESSYEPRPIKSKAFSNAPRIGLVLMGLVVLFGLSHVSSSTTPSRKGSPSNGLSFWPSSDSSSSSLIDKFISPSDDDDERIQPTGGFGSILPSRQLVGLTTGRWRPIGSQFTNSSYDSSEAQESLLHFGQEDSIRIYGTNAAKTLTDEAGGLARALRIASWGWVPDGQVLDEWDGYEIAKRLLESKYGVVFIGDSLSFLEAQAFQNLLTVSKVGLEESEVWGNTTFQPLGKLDPLDVRLAPNSHWLNRLRRELPNIPSQRFLEPIARYRRHDSLVEPYAMRVLAESKGLNWRDNLTWVNSSWSDLVPQVGDRKTWGGEKNSIVMMSTGAHWTEFALGIPAREIEGLMKEAARTVINDLVSRPLLDVVIRSTSPAQPSCANYLEPAYPPLALAADPQHPEFGWDTFGRFASIWSETLDQIAPQGKTRDGLGRVMFMNVTEMTRQRPDAYKIKRLLLPDCLHWSIAGVPSWWSRIAWHALQRPLSVESSSPNEHQRHVKRSRMNSHFRRSLRTRVAVPRR